MSDFEYYFTISAFLSGFILLIYLFRIRTKFINRMKLRLLQAKAKIHYLTRPVEGSGRFWNDAANRKRDIR